MAKQFDEDIDKLIENGELSQEEINKILEKKKAGDKEKDSE